MYTFERAPSNSFNTNWGKDEPNEAVGSDCAYLSKKAGYKMKTDNCKASKPFLCTPIIPLCPDGFEHVPSKWIYHTQHVEVDSIKLVKDMKKIIVALLYIL